MIKPSDVRIMALGFKEAVELPHFERVSFRVRNKVFATMDEKKKIAVLKLSLVEQSVFSGFDNKAVYPVAGSWGSKGWTEFDLKIINKDLFEDALRASYRNTAPKKLADQYAE